MTPSPWTTVIVLGVVLSAACGSKSDTRLEELQIKIDAACDVGREQIDIADLFPREARVCYAYKTVNDRPLHWADKEQVHGENRWGLRTFEWDRSNFNTPGGGSLRFADAEYQCRSLNELIVVRDRDMEKLGHVSCAWLIGTESEIVRERARPSLP